MPFLEYRSSQGARTPPVNKQTTSRVPDSHGRGPGFFFSTILRRCAMGAASLFREALSACAQQMLSTHLWALLTVVVAVSSFRFSTFLTRAIMSATAVPADPNLDSMAA